MSPYQLGRNRRFPSPLSMIPKSILPGNKAFSKSGIFPGKEADPADPPEKIRAELQACLRGGFNS